MTRPFVAIISLRRADARRQKIAAELAALGLPAPFFDAVDARDLAPDDPRTDPAGAEKRMGRALTPGEYACALSHRLALEAFLRGTGTHALILEDDAVVGPGLLRFVEEHGYEAASLVLLHHVRARVTSRAPVPLCAGHEGLTVALNPFRTTAYSVDRDAAAALVAAFTPVTSTADWPLDLTRLGALAAMPEIVGHPPVTKGQTMIGPRSRSRKFGPARYLSPAHLRRQWRKLRSRRIS